MALVSSSAVFYWLLTSPSSTRLVWWLTPVKITCEDDGETHFKSFQVWRFKHTTGSGMLDLSGAAHPHISRFVHIEFHISAPEMCKGLVWNYKNKCSKTHLRLVQTKARILYALEGLRYFWTSKIHTCARKNGFQQASLSSRVRELRCVSELNARDGLASLFRLEADWGETELRTSRRTARILWFQKLLHTLTEQATGQTRAQDPSGCPDKDG